MRTVKWFEFTTELSRKFLVQEMKGSLLGSLWVVASPVFQGLLYMAIFGFLLPGAFPVSIQEDPITYASLLLMGIVVVQFVTDLIGSSANLALSQRMLIRFGRVPLLSLIVANWTRAFVRLLISLVLPVALALLSPAFRGSVQGVPLLATVAILVLFSLALSGFFAVSGALLRDINQVIQPLSLVIFYTSGVFYSLAAVPTEAAAWFPLNPVFFVISQLRYAFYGIDGLPLIFFLGHAGAAAAILLLVARIEAGIRFRIAERI